MLRLALVRRTQEGCGGLRGENPAAFPKARPIFQQPFSLPESAQTLAGIAFRAAGKSGENFPAASKFAGKPFQQGVSDSHSLLKFSEHAPSLTALIRGSPCFVMCLFSSFRRFVAVRCRNISLLLGGSHWVFIKTSKERRVRGDSSPTCQNFCKGTKIRDPPPRSSQKKSPNAGSEPSSTRLWKGRDAKEPQNSMTVSVKN